MRSHTRGELLANSYVKEESRSTATVSTARNRQFHKTKIVQGISLSKSFKKFTNA